VSSYPLPVASCAATATQLTMVMNVYRYSSMATEGGREGRCRASTTAQTRCVGDVKPSHERRFQNLVGLFMQGTARAASIHTSVPECKLIKHIICRCNGSALCSWQILRAPVSPAISSKCCTRIASTYPWQQPFYDAFHHTLIQGHGFAADHPQCKSLRQ
jgi:hypothetical protein